MITLTIISLLYSIFGLMRFKKIYGHYNVYEEDSSAVFFIFCKMVAEDEIEIV